jgi:hypothetical protein
MPVESTRVPTPANKSWSIETALDHMLALLDEKTQHLKEQMGAADKRYEERFLASQKALELGLAGLIREIQAALAAADRAVLKAEAATERRFESVNEFRGTLDNQQRTLIPRSEVDVMARGLEEKIAQITKMQDAQMAERLGIKGGWGYAVGVVGLVLTLGSLYMMVGKLTTPANAPTGAQVIYVPAPAGSMLPTTPPGAVPR